MQQPATSMSRGNNSYDLVRFIAASMVLYSHHFPLAGLVEPRVPFYGEKYGELAVGIFFCLSGFLIFRSLEKTQDWGRFFAARFLRVMPNLTAVLVVTSLATLLYFRNFEHLVSHLVYALRNILMFFVGPTFKVPGVFESAANPAINGPLWSLRYELNLYVVLFLFFVWGGKYRNWLIALSLPLLVYPWATNTEKYFLSADIFEFSRLGQMFFSGSLLAFLWPYWKNRAVMFGFVGVALMVLLEYTVPFNSFLNTIPLAAATIGLGSSSLFSKFGRGGDGSYGMYICAWPIQQFCIMYIQNFWLSMLAAFVLTVAAGYLTWHLYEKRCMQQVDRLSATFHRWAGLIRKRPATT